MHAVLRSYQLLAGSLFHPTHFRSKRGTEAQTNRSLETARFVKNALHRSVVGNNLVNDKLLAIER